LGNGPGARRGHAVTGGDQDVGKAGQHGPLGGVEGHAGTSWVERLRASWSLQRRARAAIVAGGVMALGGGQRLAAEMQRVGASCARPQASTTELPGSTPILAVPRRCQPVSRMSGATMVS